MKNFAAIRGFKSLAAAALLAVTAPAAFAQVTWVGGASNDWSTIANWTNGSLANNFSQAIVFGGANNTTNNDLTSGTATNISFSSGAGAFTLAGNSITLSGTIGNRATTNTQSISLPMVLTSASHQITNVAGGSLLISGNMSGGAVASATSVFIQTVGGTVTLSGNNSYTGLTVLNGGTLQIGHNNALGSGTFVTGSNSSGTNVIRGYNADLTSIPTAVLLRTATTTFDGNYGLTFSGSLVSGFSSGTVNIVNQMVSGKKLTFSGTTYIQDPGASGGRELRLRGTGTTEFSGAIVDGGVAGSGTLAISGTSVAILSASNSLTGGISVGTAGWLLLNHATPMGSGTLVFPGSSSFDNISGSPVTATSHIRMSGGSATFAGTNNSTFTTTGTLSASGGNRTLTVSSGTVEVGGLSMPFASIARLTKDGTGTMIVNNAADVATTGTFRISGGTVIIGNAAALGSGTIEFNSTSAVLQSKSADLSLSNVVFLGSSPSSFSGSYSLTFSNTLQLGSDRRLSNTIGPNKALTFTGTTNLNSSTSGTSDRVLTIVGTGSTVFSGPIIDGNSGTSGFTQNSTGTTTLSVANSYNGTTTVLNGTLLIGNASSLGNAGGRLVIGGTGTLDLAGLNVTRSGSIQLTGTGQITNGTITNNTTAYDVQSGTMSASAVLAGSVGLTKTTTGTATLLNSNSYAGNTTVSDGNLVIGNAGSLGSASAALTAGGGTLDLGGFAVSRSGAVALTGGSIVNGTLTNNTTAFDAQAGTASAILDGSVGLTKTTSGTVTLSNANTYAGNTTVSAGVLIAGAVGAFSSGTVTVASGASLDLGGYAVTNSITNNGGSLLNAGGYAGTQSLLGSSTFSALGGTLTVGSGGYGSFTGSIAASVAVLSGGTADIATGGSFTQPSVSNDGKLTYSGTVNGSLATAFTGAGSFEKLATSVLTMSGTSSFGAGVSVSAGKLLVTGSIGGGTVNVANAAAIGGSGQIGGDLAFASGAHFQFDPANTLTVAGNTTFAGSFGVDKIDGLSASTTPGTYNLIAGNVDFTNVTNVGSGNAYNVPGTDTWAYLQQGSLQMVVVPEPESITLVSFAGLALLTFRRRRKAKAGPAADKA